MTGDINTAVTKTLQNSATAHALDEIKNSGHVDLIREVFYSMTRKLMPSCSPTSVQHANIRMIQTGDRPGFAFKTLAKSSGIGEVQRQNFDGDCPVQARIPRFVHFTHSTRAKGRKYFEGPSLVPALIGIRIGRDYSRFGHAELKWVTEERLETPTFSLAIPEEHCGHRYRRDLSSPAATAQGTMEVFGGSPGLTSRCPRTVAAGTNVFEVEFFLPSLSYYEHLFFLELSEFSDLFPAFNSR